jgi:hypothetical protein
MMPAAVEAASENYERDLALIERVKREMAGNADVMRVCLIAEQALRRRDGTPRFDRKSYMRNYMVYYRAKKRLDEPEVP